LLLALPLAAAAGAQAYKAEVVAAEAPAEVAAGVKAELAPGASRVTGPDGVLCELWIRKSVPARAKPEAALGVNYAELSEGALLGVIRFARDAKDYRRQGVRAGVYTLRYALLPVDGNHMGVAPNRDFVLLSRAADDASAGGVGMEALLERSRKASGSSHPTIWALWAGDAPETSLPAMQHEEEGDMWILVFRIKVQPEGGAEKELTIELVVSGSAPEA
jgi:hypothetical protein